MVAQRGRPRAATADQDIAAATLALLAERGYAGTTIEQVAKRTGISRPTIYRRFENREEMIHRAITDVLDASLDALRDDPDPYRNVRNHLRNTITMLTQSPVGPIYRAVLAEIPHVPELAQVVREIGAARRARLKRAFRLAVQNGSLSAPRQLDVAVDALIGAIYFRYLMPAQPLTPAYADQLLREFRRS